MGGQQAARSQFIPYWARNTYFNDCSDSDLPDLYVIFVEAIWLQVWEMEKIEPNKLNDGTGEYILWSGRKMNWRSIRWINWKRY